MTKINEEGVIFFTINKRDGRIFSRWMEKNSKSKIRVSSFISEVRVDVVAKTQGAFS